MFALLMSINKKRAAVLMALMVVITAATSQEICVGLKRVPLQEREKNAAQIYAEAAPVHFSVRGNTYKIKTRYSQLELLSSEGQVLQRIDIRQSIGGHISEMVMRSDGWLWLNGRDTDYFIFVNKEKSVPEFAHAIKISIERHEECIPKDAGQEPTCMPADSFYSKALDRVLIITYPKAQSAGGLYEMEQGRFTKIFEGFDSTDRWRVVDLPSLKQVFISGISDGYLYDGRKIDALHLKGFRDQERRSPWWFPHTLGSRVFISNSHYQRKGGLYELLSNGVLSEIFFDDSVNLTQGLYAMKGEVFAFGDKGVYLLMGKFLKKLISVKGDDRISYVRDSGDLAEGVLFSLYEDGSLQKAKAQYVLSPRGECRKIRRDTPLSLKYFD